MTFPLALHCPAASLFHDASGTASADLDIDGHRKPSPFAADSFGIGCDVDEETGSAASTKTIRSVVDLLEARAQFDAFTSSLNTTVARISISPTQIDELSR